MAFQVCPLLHELASALLFYVEQSLDMAYHENEFDLQPGSSLQMRQSLQVLRTEG